MSSLNLFASVKRYSYLTHKTVWIHGEFHGICWNRNAIKVKAHLVFWELSGFLRNIFWRRGWDSNPRAPTKGQPDFESGALRPASLPLRVGGTIVYSICEGKGKSSIATAICHPAIRPSGQFRAGCVEGCGGVYAHAIGFLPVTIP